MYILKTTAKNESNENKVLAGCVSKKQFSVRKPADNSEVSNDMKTKFIYIMSAELVGQAEAKPYYISI